MCNFIYLFLNFAVKLGSISKQLIQNRFYLFFNNYFSYKFYSVPFEVGFARIIPNIGEWFGPVQVTTDEEEKTGVIFLTKPLSLDGDSEVDYRAPNLIKRVLSLFKNVRPGSDLSRFQVSLVLLLS